MERWDAMVCDERDEKKFWYRVGTMFRNKSGDGFTLIVPPGVSVSGRIALLVPKSKDDWANGQRASQGRPPRGQEQFTPPADDEDIPF